MAYAVLLVSKESTVYLSLLDICGLKI